MREQANTERTADAVARWPELPRPLAGFIACFNSARFHEAHDVLEALWLRDRHGPDGEFFKGLIQLAGAFVHVQKGRMSPASSLLRLSRQRLAAYPTGHFRLDTQRVLGWIDEWLLRLTPQPCRIQAWSGGPWPQLECLRH